MADHWGERAQRLSLRWRAPRAQGAVASTHGVIDPFENFEEQQRSYELLQEHREALVADALELLREHPGLEVVGLVLDADASEASAMRRAFEQATGQNFAGRGFIG